MSIFKRALKKIEFNKHVRETGKYNCIPFPFKRLRNYLPGIIKGVQYLITANSGVGKTQLAKYMFVYSPYKFIKNNPESNIKLKILYFALEESKEEFMLTMIANRLKEKYNIGISVTDLQSFNTSLSDDILEKIKECEEYFEDLETNVEIIDSISNPTGIYKYVKDYSRDNGTHYYYNFKEKDLSKRIIISEKEYTKSHEQHKYAYSHYEPNDPDEYVIVLVDHMSLLHPEKGETLHDAMTSMSANYARKQITKHFKYVFVGIQQQASDKEKMLYTYKGGAIESKLEPSLDGLGDNKTTQRDALVVLGLFAPDRYQIENHLGYDVVRLRDNYRCLSILKNRIGTPNKKLGLFFDGRSNIFKELPEIMNNADYEKINYMLNG